jgi:hypothetical protein
MCVYRASSFSDDCRRFDHLIRIDRVSRHSMSWVRRAVCLPGSEGWIGDRCLRDGECMSGYCHRLEGESAGICSEACNRYCPDLEGGYAITFCVSSDPDYPENGGMCVARCAGDDDCPLGTSCRLTPRHSQEWVQRSACVVDP